MRSCALFICLLATGAARAGANDLQLYRLGHPDPLACTRCDGSPGDVPEPGDPLAQARFHRLASTLGLAFVPAFVQPANTLGWSGFEMGFSSAQAFLHIPADAWPTASGVPPRVLELPTFSMRKGLGGSLELGAAASWLASSQMFALSAELRWAILDGIAFAPDLAVRAFGTRLVGTQELELTMGGADAQLSKRFGLAGTFELQPYVQGGVVLIDAQSGVVDFKPGTVDAANPTAPDGVFHRAGFLDNRYLRAAAGLRLVAGYVVFGVEESVAEGRNAVQSDPLPGGAPVPTDFVRLWSTQGLVGLTF